MKTSSHDELFEYLSQKYSLTPTESELLEIENIVLEDYLGADLLNEIKACHKVTITFIDGNINKVNIVFENPLIVPPRISGVE